MKRYIFILIFISCNLGFYESAYSLSRERAISQTLDRVNHQRTERILTELGESSPRLERTLAVKKIARKILDKIELEIAIGMGYLYGDTSYEINFPAGDYVGRSKLEFPFGNWLAGGKVSIGYGSLYLNFSGWTNITEKASGDMKDKDWIEDFLFSSTESDADAKITILDASLLYNFWQGTNFWGDESAKFQKGKAGFLIGYKYENFRYDIFGVRDVLGGASYYSGQKVLDYNVKYYIPYLGVSGYYFQDIADENPQFLESWGLGARFCWAPYLKAKDLDDHILRSKLSAGRTKGYGILFGLNAFLTTKSNWICRLGFDYTYIETDGHQNQHFYAGPYNGITFEGINLQIKSSQYLFWSRIQYKF